MKTRIPSITKIVSAAGCALLVTACGGSSGSGGDTGGFGSDDDCNPVNAGCYFELTGGTGHSVNQFDGRWLSGCVFLEEDDGKFSEDAAYRVESVNIGGNTGNRTTNYYSDINCAAPASVSEVTSTLELYYAAIFTDNTVGVDNVVLVNITASDLLFDSAEPSAAQTEEISRSRADRTFYTSMQRLDTALYIGKPRGFTDGRNSDDRILQPYDSSNPNSYGIAYIQQ